jgi:hypothetical protein
VSATATAGYTVAQLLRSVLLPKRMRAKYEAEDTAQSFHDADKFRQPIRIVAQRLGLAIIDDMALIQDHGTR